MLPISLEFHRIKTNAQKYDTQRAHNTKTQLRTQFSKENLHFKEKSISKKSPFQMTATMRSRFS